MRAQTTPSLAGYLLAVSFIDQEKAVLMMNPCKKLVCFLLAARGGRHWLEEEATLKAAGLKDAADNNGG